jgi:hypothetical protein
MNKEQIDRRDRREVQPRATRALAVGAAALGAFALGSAAVGAVAIGRVAIGAFAMKRGRVRTLAVDNLEVRRLHVGELTIRLGPAAVIATAECDETYRDRDIFPSNSVHTWFRTLA